MLKLSVSIQLFTFSYSVKLMFPKPLEFEKQTTLQSLQRI